MKDKCDICGKKTNDLVDYFVLLCNECKIKHKDIVLLKIIGRLLNEKEE